MLISNHRKFIFIHVYKNAGTSIRSALWPFVLSKWEESANEVCRRIHCPILFNPKPYHSHLTASEAIVKLGQSKFDSYYSFGIVRNPWDWQVSLYRYMLKNTAHHQHEHVSSLKDFNEYIVWRCDNEARLQKDYLYSIDGELLVDFVGKYETLDTDFDSICNRIGISASLPKLNVSNTKPYQEYYSTETRDLVNKVFEPDIKLFGYSF